MDSLHALRATRTESAQSGRVEDADNISDNVADVLRDMAARIEARTAEAVEMRARLELTEQTRSSAEEEASRLREENERLKAELEAERGKGFWRRLLGG